MVRHVYCWGILAFVTLAGCGPAVSEEELGKVHYQMPAVPGTEKPYELPALDPDAETDPHAGHEHAGHSHD